MKNKETTSGFTQPDRLKLYVHKGMMEQPPAGFTEGVLQKLQKSPAVTPSFSGPVIPVKIRITIIATILLIYITAFLSSARVDSLRINLPDLSGLISFSTTAWLYSGFTHYIWILSVAVFSLFLLESLIKNYKTSPA